MTVFVQNLTINAGETFSRDLDILSADGTGGVDLTGYTANSHLRKHPDSSGFTAITVGITSAAYEAFDEERYSVTYSTGIQAPIALSLIHI